MELYILNKNLELQGIVDSFQTLIWTRKAQEVGNFQLNLSPSEDNLNLLKKDYLVFRKDSKEIGVINHIEYKLETSKETLEIKGNFASNYISKRINASIVNFNGTIENFIRQMINNNCINPTDKQRIIPNLILGDSKGYTDTITIQDSYSNLIKLINNSITDTDICYRTTLDIENKKLIFELYKGTDRTVENADNNPPTVFCRDMENIVTETYILDNSDSSNMAYVFGEGEDNNRTKVLVNNNLSGLSRSELYVDARDLQKTSNDVTLTDSQYNDTLRQRGIEKLKEATDTETFEATINTNGNNVYKTDYDLGDKVTILDKKIGVILNTMITQIEETYESGKVTITPTFGNKIPSLLDKIRRHI